MSSSFHVWGGSEIGFLKGINLNDETWENLNSISEANRLEEICCMCWENKYQTKMAVAKRSGLVQELCTDSLDLVDLIQAAEEGDVIKGICSCDRGYVTCTESGVVRIWDPDGEDSDKLKFSAGKDICCMKKNEHDENLLGTGGKGNCLKVWDLQNTSEPVFKAKNVPNNFLNLHVPVWVQDLQFCPGSKRIMTATGLHKVRLYDPSSSQKRPVAEVAFGEDPLTSLSLRNEHQCIVGNTTGSMGLLDLRTKRLVHKYKGAAGAVRSLLCHPEKPWVFSCGLDRYVRVHDIESRELVHKIYLKTKMTAMLVFDDLERVPSESAVPDELAEDLSEEAAATSDVSDEEVDELWKKLDNERETSSIKPKPSSKVKRKNKQRKEEKSKKLKNR